MDESENPERYWVGALLCRETDINELELALETVCLRAYDDFGVELGAELHGHRIFHGQDDWEHLYVRARIAVDANALKVLRDSQVEILLRGVNLRQLRERYASPDHPHSVCLSHLIERLDERSENLYGGTEISLIADEHHQADVYQRELWTFQRYATEGYRSRQIVHVKDLEFMPSHEHRLLQAIDLVTFLNQRIYERVGKDEKADRANLRLWELISHQVVHRHCWNPRHG